MSIQKAPYLAFVVLACSCFIFLSGCGNLPDSLFGGNEKKPKPYASKKSSKSKDEKDAAGSGNGETGTGDSENNVALSSGGDEETISISLPTNPTRPQPPTTTNPRVSTAPLPSPLPTQRALEVFRPAASGISTEVGLRRLGKVAADRYTSADGTSQGTTFREFNIAVVKELVELSQSSDASIAAVGKKLLEAHLEFVRCAAAEKNVPIQRDTLQSAAAIEGIELAGNELETLLGVMQSPDTYLLSFNRGKAIEAAEALRKEALAELADALQQFDFGLPKDGSNEQLAVRFTQSPGDLLQVALANVSEATCRDAFVQLDGKVGSDIQVCYAIDELAPGEEVQVATLSNSVMNARPLLELRAFGPTVRQQQLLRYAASRFTSLPPFSSEKKPAAKIIDILIPQLEDEYQLDFEMLSPNMVRGEEFKFVEHQPGTYHVYWVRPERKRGEEVVEPQKSVVVAQFKIEDRSVMFEWNPGAESDDLRASTINQLCNYIALISNGQQCQHVVLRTPTVVPITFQADEDTQAIDLNLPAPPALNATSIFVLEMNGCSFDFRSESEKGKPAIITGPEPVGGAQFSFQLVGGDSLTLRQESNVVYLGRETPISTERLDSMKLINEKAVKELEEKIVLHRATLVEGQNRLRGHTVPFSNPVAEARRIQQVNQLTGIIKDAADRLKSAEERYVDAQQRLAFIPHGRKLLEQMDKRSVKYAVSVGDVPLAVSHAELISTAPWISKVR